MGALLGLIAGIGLLLLVDGLRAQRRGSAGDDAGDSGAARPAALPGAWGRWTSTRRDRLAQAGLGRVTPAGLWAVSIGCGLVAGVVLLGVSRSVVVAGAFAVLAGRLPWAVVAQRARATVGHRRDEWPVVVDHLTSGVRAGLSLPEALAGLAERGPERMRPAFARFAADYRARGSFGTALDGLRADLADPVGDRVVETLRVASEVGGSDVGRVLRSLSAFLREDARMRAELAARQSWHVSAARLALAAPWIMLGLLSLRPEAVAAYDSAAGFAVLAIGGGVTLVAYRLMLRLGQLPAEPRVLR
jgi:tight adherence protein B